MNAAVRQSRLRRAGQFTALVDILFATIGIFVIVFALQEIDPPVTMLPAPYDAVVICDTDRSVSLYSSGDTEPQRFAPRDIGEKFAAALAKGGRILFAITRACALDPGDGIVVIDRVRDIEVALNERSTGDETPLLLLEIAPLADDGASALLGRFLGQDVE